MFAFKKKLGLPFRRNARRNGFQLESLEQRQMMTITSMAVDSAGTLNIRCNDAADNITVYQSGASTLVQSVSPTGGTTVSNMGTGVKFLDIRTFGGNDTVNNNTNLRSSIWGGSGEDTLNGGSNIDSIWGEAGKDTINGNNSGDYLYGGTGNDTIRGGAGNDYIEGDDYATNNISIYTEPMLPYTNNDTIYGGSGVDEIYGQIGNDMLYGGGGSDNLYGGRGIDYLFGDDVAQSFFVAEDNQYSGNDKLYGGDDGDTLYGGYGSDTLYGGYGNDHLWGGDNNDKLFGEAGSDYLDGQGHDDFLDSGSATEAVYGTWGNDFNAYKTAVGGTKLDDISQGNTGNCFILAAMGAAANRGINLSSLITYVGNGVYSVALYKVSPATGMLTPTNVRVTFDGALYSTDPTAHNRGQRGESWTVIMSRAMASVLNYNPNGEDGGVTARAMEALLGTKATITQWTDNSFTPVPMFNDSILDFLFQVGNARPTTASSRLTAAELSSNMFVEQHAYVVRSVAITGWSYSPLTFQYIPNYTVTLYNPWGEDISTERLNKGTGSVRGERSDGLLVITGAEFKRNFRAISIV